MNTDESDKKMAEYLAFSAWYPATHIRYTAGNWISWCRPMLFAAIIFSVPVVGFVQTTFYAHICTYINDLFFIFINVL
jgi:hypothetical protein